MLSREKKNFREPAKIQLKNDQKREKRESQSFYLPLKYNTQSRRAINYRHL